MGDVHSLGEQRWERGEGTAVDMLESALNKIRRAEIGQVGHAILVIIHQPEGGEPGEETLSVLQCGDFGAFEVVGLMKAVVDQMAMDALHGY